MIFRQKNGWFNSRVYVLEQNGVKVVTGSFLNTTRIYYNFHDIGKSITLKMKRSWVPLLGFSAALLHSAWCLINGESQSLLLASILLAGLNLLIYFVTGKKYLNLGGERNTIPLKFIYDNPSTEDLMAFISHIQKAQRISLQQLYLTINEGTAYEDYRRNIEWLLKNEFISEEEAVQRLGENTVSFG